MRALAAACAVAVGVVLAAQDCANGCNGHGSCDAYSRCVCFDGYTGNDCGMRTCPTAPAAWTAKSSAADTGALTTTTHRPNIECSNAGECSRETGTCSCYPGFSGAACEKMACPNSCNGHGKCLDIFAIGQTLGGDSSIPLYDGVGHSYANWDRVTSYGCVCDAGYSGADCSLVNCPLGDSPHTQNQQRKTVRLVVDFSDILTVANRKIRIIFGGQRSTQLSFVSAAAGAVRGRGGR